MDRGEVRRIFSRSSTKKIDTLLELQIGVLAVSFVATSKWHCTVS